MSDSISICFNKVGNTQLPCDINDSEAYACFREDNPHVMGRFIPHGMPFIVRNDNSLDDSGKTWRQAFPQKATLFTQLKTMPLKERETIADMVNQYGADLLTAMAMFNDEYIKPLDLKPSDLTGKFDPRDRSNQVGYTGAAFGAAETRFNRFGDAAKYYQKTLENVRKATLAKKPRAEILKLEQIAKKAHANLNTKFKSEIQKFANRAGTRGTAWTNAQRGINQAKSARSFQPINLSTTREFSLIKGFASKAKLAGGAMLVLDAGMRTDKVFDTYQAGGNWQKHAFKETAGLSTAVYAASIAGNIAIRLALGVALASTPVGWVVVIGVGLGASYAAGQIGDYVGQLTADKIYDSASKFKSL